ncbi:GNAT family N-acetyltransferase [Aliivibrio fischeri]|uniref:GNAT family N-acetyltransferase n=1 Tax=Aliivibrio fischeri TaxID=668 RepID=UPI0012D918D2|nr:N-acetyltransferase [Aliivibrio fischeri]MUK31888.1 GNAT family N-acetyltransferase [Aliivibrio fischeri]
MDITLRKATKSDLDFLVNLRDLTMRKYLDEVGAPVTREAYLERINYQFEDAKIIELDNKAIGLFKVTYLSESNQLYIAQIQIEPEYQGLSVGSYLINQVINEAYKNKQSVSLNVLKSNPAQKLYSKLGFKKVGESETEFNMEYQA